LKVEKAHRFTTDAWVCIAKITVLWNVMPPTFSLEMEATGSSETLIPIF
jgi:hypothetical protein